MNMFPGRKPGDFDFTEILYEKKGPVALVTINRPKFYNAYNTQALKELIAAFTDAAWDDEIAVVVYTGAGDKAFSTGGDLNNATTETTVEGWTGIVNTEGYRAIDVDDEGTDDEEVGEDDEGASDEEGGEDEEGTSDEESEDEFESDSDEDGDSNEDWLDGFDPDEDE